MVQHPSFAVIVNARGFRAGNAQIAYQIPQGLFGLPEISSISLETQAKLLRVIQEKEFLPLGSVESKVVDVRLLAV